MAGLQLENLIGSYVYIGFAESLVVAGYEPPGPTKLVFVKLTGVTDRGIFFEHDKFPLTNIRTGLVELSRTQVFIPYQKVSHISSFPDLPNFDDYIPSENPVTFS